MRTQTLYVNNYVSDITLRNAGADLSGLEDIIYESLSKQFGKAIVGFLAEHGPSVIRIRKGSRLQSDDPELYLPDTVYFIRADVLPLRDADPDDLTDMMQRDIR